MTKREALLRIRDKYRRSSDAYQPKHPRSDWANGFPNPMPTVQRRDRDRTSV